MSSNTSTGQWLGYIAGAVVGYFTGGTSYILMGAAIGGAIGGAIDPAKGPPIYGPRLSDLSQQGASYGAPIPRIYGATALMGNIFWIENNALKETKKKETQGGKGGGGSEVTTYTYSATFALGLCRGVIGGVRRIWISGKLVYDIGSSDPSTISASHEFAKWFTFYPGSSTQLPNPRMQSALGADNTPAYRGLAYIVFEDLELTDYGNTLLGAQIKVEVYESGTVGDWVRVIDNTDTGYQFYTNYDTAQPRPVITEANGYFVVYGYSSGFDVILGPDGSYLATRPNASPPVLPSVASSVTGLYWDCLGQIRQGAIGRQYVWTYKNYDYFPSQQPMIAWGAKPDAAYRIDMAIPQDRRMLAGIIDNSGEYILVISGDVGVIDGATTHTAAVWTLIDGTGTDIDSGTIDASSIPFSGVSKYTFGNSRGVTNGVSANAAGFDAVEMAVISTMTDTNVHRLHYWTIDAVSKVMSVAYTTVLVADSIYRPSVYTSYGIILAVYGNKLALFSKGRAQTSSANLSTIVSEECALSGILAPADIDVTTLTDSVAGYRIASAGTIRSALEPLQIAYPFDVIPSGYGIRFKRRSETVSSASIPNSDVGLRGDKNDPQMKREREMQEQMPTRIAVSYLDVDREYDAGEQQSERLTVGAANERRIELPIVLTADAAAKISEITLYSAWAAREKLSCSLSPAWRHLEPGDIVTINWDLGQKTVGIDALTFNPDGSIECMASPRIATYASTAAGSTGETGSGTIALAGLTHLCLLDIPTLTESYNVSGFIVAASGYSAGWHGAAIYRSLDGGMAWSNITSIVDASRIGTVATAAPAPADARLMDKSTRLVARFFADNDPSSITETALLQGVNHFAYGADGRWEIIAAQTVTPIGDGTVALTNLLRGRFGTEWAMASHAAYDQIVHLSADRLAFCVTDQSYIGRSLDYKGVTLGRPIDGAGETAFTYAGQNLECLSPVYLNGNRHPTTNDWTLTWIRRTRVGGEWRDYVDAPLSEATEAYEVEIYTSAAYTTLKRTISGLTSATASYTSAQQVTDFGGNQATLYVKVYQLSSVVGRGQPLTTSITR